MYATQAIPSTPTILSIKVKPSVKLIIPKLIATGSNPTVTDRKKNCFTTPSGIINANVSPIAAPTIEPKNIMINIIPKDFLRINKA